VARYRKPLVNGDAEDVHGAAVGSSRDRWCSRHGGSGLLYDHHFTRLGRLQVKALSVGPVGDVVDFIVHQLDIT